MPIKTEAYCVLINDSPWPLGPRPRLEISDLVLTLHSLVTT